MISASVKTYIENAKRAFAENALDTAVENWNKIYNELEDDEYRAELFEAMSKFSNDEVFGITEHFKQIVGYYF